MIKVIVVIVTIVILLSPRIIDFWDSHPKKTKDCKLPESRSMAESLSEEEKTLLNPPKLKPLSEEQIREIHSRGMITPEEKVREWESFDLCAPGDAIGSAANRCKKFGYNCHECLIDYASGKDEYHPLELSICHPYDDKQNN